MKNLMLILICFSVFERAMATETEKIKFERTLSFPSSSPDNILEIYNINGGLVVEGYDGKEVIAEVVLTITAKTTALLTKAKSELSLGVLEDDSALVLYNKAPFIRNERIDGKCNCNWMKDVDYDFSFEFKVKVPRDVNVRLSTVNDGDILVSLVNGSVYAHHVNGAITLNRIGGSVDAKTINGDLTVDHTRVPLEESSYYSFNGDVNVSYPGEPNAEITFKSFNGAFFTNMDQVEILGPKWVKEEKSGNGGTQYKLTEEKKIKVGQGGNLLAFETFNGNIYVKKSK